MIRKSEIHEDVYIPTQCGRCYAQCGIRVRRVNGVAVKVEGNPDTTLGSEGGLCAKGVAAGCPSRSTGSGRRRRQRRGLAPGAGNRRRRLHPGTALRPGGLGGARGQLFRRGLQGADGRDVLPVARLPAQLVHARLQLDHRQPSARTPHGRQRPASSRCTAPPTCSTRGCSSAVDVFLRNRFSGNLYAPYTGTSGGFDLQATWRLGIGEVGVSGNLEAGSGWSAGGAGARATVFF